MLVRTSNQGTQKVARAMALMGPGVATPLGKGVEMLYEWIMLLAWCPPVIRYWAFP